jgi:hypothetical protein
VSTPIKHATYAGYQTHKRRGVKPCDECTEANRAYLAKWRERNPGNTARHAATNNARDRAYRALAKLYPDEFKQLYAIELRRLTGTP